MGELSLSRRIAVGAFTLMLAAGIAGDNKNAVKAAETIPPICPPELGSPDGNQNLVRINQDILTRHGLTISQAVNRSIACRIDSQQTTINVDPGTYTFGNALRMESDVELSGSGADTKLVYQPASDDDEAIGVPSKGNHKNITIKNLELTGPGGTEKEIDGIQLSDTSNAHISGIKVRSFSRDGIHFYFDKEQNGVNSSTISDCESSDNGRNGISITSGGNNVIEDCVITNNNLKRPGVYGVAGISLESDSSNKVSDNIVRRNIITDNKHNGIGLATENPDKGGTFGNTIHGNILNGNKADQISELTEDPKKLNNKPNVFACNTPQPEKKTIKRGSIVPSGSAAECSRG